MKFHTAGQNFWGIGKGDCAGGNAPHAEVKENVLGKIIHTQR